MLARRLETILSNNMIPLKQFKKDIIGINMVFILILLWISKWLDVYRL